MICLALILSLVRLEIGARDLVLELPTKATSDAVRFRPILWNGSRVPIADSLLKEKALKLS